MSIANLFVPNDYNLYANSITVNGSENLSDGILMNDGLTPSSARPAIGPGPAGYLIRAYDGQGGQSSAQGFLRLAAGGGTLSTDQSGIDVSGASNTADIDKYIYFYTAGSDRAYFDTNGLNFIPTTTVTGYTPSPLNIFEQYVGDITYSGAITTTVSNGIQIERLNNRVTISLTNIPDTVSVSAEVEIVGTKGTGAGLIPPRFLPTSAEDASAIIYVNNDGTFGTGRFLVDTNGINLFGNLAGSNWAVGTYSPLPNNVSITFYLY